MSNAFDDIQERELHQLQQMQHKAKESCMKSFRLLQSHPQGRQNRGHGNNARGTGAAGYWGAQNRPHSKKAALNQASTELQILQDRCADAIASNSELNVSGLTELQEAHNVVNARCLELEAELSNLRDNICCSKHIDGDSLERLTEFLKKFIGTVRFGNDHFGAIIGYGDYVVGDNVISRVYYVEGLGHNLFSVGQFCDSVLEVASESILVMFVKRMVFELLKGNDEVLPNLLAIQSSSTNHGLWHRRFKALELQYIMDLARKDCHRLTRLKIEKIHL
ncbi:hypothetical protein Tco_0539790 [Tanacetum coccineum]